jgi:DNA-binding SARP family transcriptional activator
MAREETSGLLDGVEALRRRGRLNDALEAVERVLAVAPEHRRALLLKSRLLYQNGALGRALDVARALDPLIGGEAAELIAALVRLDQAARRPEPFATESMARLLAEQGYFLEAIEVYRQLFEGTANRPGIRDEIVRLTETAAREGSRDADAERVRHELDVSARWLEQHPRGS